MMLIDKLTSKITSLFKTSKPTAEVEDVQSTDHYSEVASQAQSESLFNYDIFKVENDRRSVLADVQKLLDEDPRVAEANKRMANAATRGGITVVVSGATSDIQAKNKKARPGATKARSNATANKAQQILNDLVKTAKVNAKVNGWAKRLVSDGDLMLNVIVDMRDNTIVDIRRVPPITMKRNVDDRGQFIDINQAFSQLDPAMHAASLFAGIPDSASRHFALWQMNHIRWDHTDGDVYGNSQYKQIRSLVKKLQMTEEDLVVRRRTRAPQRRLHTVGNKEKPQNWDAVEEYKKKNSLGSSKFKVTTDYYGNGLTDIKNLDGDAKLHEIADIIYLLNMAFLRLGVPKGLLGFAEDINRDVLEDQYKEYEKSLEQLTDALEYGDSGAFSGLRDIFDFALLLQGINPDSVSYNIRWSDKSNEPTKDRIDRVLKVMRGKLLSRRTALQSIANDFDVESVDEELAAIDEESKAALALLAGMPPILEPRETQLTDGYGHSHITDAQEWADGFQEKEINALEAKVLKQTQKLFSNVHKKLKKKIAEQEQEVTDAADAEVDDEAAHKATQKIIDSFDSAWIDETALYLNAMSPFYRSAAGLGGEYAYIQLGLEFKLLTEDIFNRVYNETGERIKGIGDTTREQIRVALSEGYMAGEGALKIAARIDKVFNTAQSVRSVVIARTEMMWAYNQSSKAHYKGAGVERVEWSAARDARTCPICKALDGNIYDIDDAPDIPKHPQCRCTLLPIMP